MVDHYGKTLKPEKSYWLTISNPEAWPYGYLAVQDRRREDLPTPYVYEGFISYVDLWEKFIAAGQGIKAYCDFETCPPVPSTMSHLYRGATTVSPTTSSTSPRNTASTRCGE